MKIQAKRFFLFAAFAICGCCCWGQPVGSSKQEIGGLQIYADFKNSSMFYYAPGDLKLALEPDGKPQFQLLEMRYTGSSAYNDSGEKRFLNVVQFTVAMENISSDDLALVKQQLPTNRADLRPLPIKDIQTILVTPVGSPDQGSPYQRIGQDGSFQSDGTDTSNKNGFWTERTYTLKLENHEAQLLWDQVEGGQLALSLGYTFYADIIPGNKGDMEVTGDRSLAEDFESDSEHLLTTDTIATQQIVKADAFPIRIDIGLWPDLLKKVDINEGVPPAYAALEVRCYDFVNDFRPDLAIKSIELQATGVSGRIVNLPPKKFLGNQPDLYTLQIHFPYAVKMDEPLRYRVTEYSLEGGKNTSPWATKDAWVGSLDITTPIADQKFAKRNLEVEVDLVELVEKDINRIMVLLIYSYRGNPKQQQLVFTSDTEIPIQSITFQYDHDSEIFYESIFEYQDGQTKREIEKVIADNYLYIKPVTLEAETN